MTVRVTHLQLTGVQALPRAMQVIPTWGKKKKDYQQKNKEKLPSAFAVWPQAFKDKENAI